MTANSAGDQWMRRAAKPRGLIVQEPVARPPTTGERMSAAVRAAAGRSLRTAPTTDDAAGR